MKYIIRHSENIYSDSLICKKNLLEEAYFPWRLSQSQSYVMTDGQSTSLSWCQSPIWDLRPDLYFCQTVAGLLMWGALSDERTGLSFTM
jgi:hypothetical protein